MAAETPLEGDVDKRRKEAVIDKIMLRDMALRHKLGVLGILALAALPTLLKPSELRTFTTVIYLMMFAISWDVVSGYTGQLSFGHAFFFALGGYGTAVATTQHGIHPLGGILLGTLVAAIGGILIGVPALRLDGPYLSLVTLIAPLLLYQSFIFFGDGLPVLAPKGLGGTGGLAEQPTQFIGVSTNTLVTVDQLWLEVVGRYYASFLALLIVLVACYAVTRSAAGSVFTAIREDEDAVRSVGLNPAKFKIFAFVLSAAVGGFAAAVWMHAGGYPDTESLFGPGRIDLSINVIVIAIIGGMGTVVGSIVGAIFFAFANQATEAFVPALSPLPTFLLGMIVLVFAPRGVVPTATTYGRRFLARRRGEEPPGDSGQSPSESTLAKYREEIEDILGRGNR